MRLRTFVFCCALAAPGLGIAGSAPRISGSGAVAVGGDDNLNAAVDAEEKVGSGYGQLKAGVVAAAGPTRSVFTAGLRYSGRGYVNVPALSSHAARLGVGVRLLPVYWFSLALTPSVRGRWVSDSARRSVDLALGGSVRFRPTRLFSITTGYDVMHRAAVESVFGGTTHTGRAGLELRITRRTFLGAEAEVGSGPVVRYEDVPIGVSGAGSGQGQGQGQDQVPSDVFAEDQVAVRSTATTQTIVLDFEQGLTAVVYARVFGGLSLLHTNSVTSTAHFAELSVGFRLP